MSSTAFSLRGIAITVFAPSMLLGIGQGAILPVIALGARSLGSSVPTAALIVTLVGIGALTSNIPGSLLTVRIGERWALVAAALWSALGMALCAWTSHLGLFALGTFMVGMAQSVTNIARLSYLTEAVPSAYRARVMSTLGGVIRIGLFIGPFLAAAAIHRHGLTGAYGVGIAAMALAGLVAARLPDLQPRTVEATGEVANSAPAAATPTWREIAREHRRLFVTLGVGVLLVSAVRATRQAVIPLWADHLGLEPAVVSLIYGLAGGIETLVFYPAGVVMDKKGRRWVAVPSMAVMGLALVFIPFTGGVSTLLLAAALIGFGNGISSGLILTLGADHAPRVGRTLFLGVWRLMSDLGAACGPAMLSLLVATFSLGTAIGMMGLVAFAASAQMGWWIPRAGSSRAQAIEATTP